jgi:hypothetical protein
VNVSAVIVTRGDVDLSPVLDSLPRDWQKVVWDNSKREQDLAVYGRYAAIEECEHDLIYVQDDDCVLEPESIAGLVRAATAPAAVFATRGDEPPPSLPQCLVANMPRRFRETGFYDDHCLVGFGAMFHRDLPEQAFDRYAAWRVRDGRMGWRPSVAEFYRMVDIPFTILTPRILVDLPYTDLPWASAPNRMWKSEGHLEERTRMRDLMREVRDA